MQETQNNSPITNCSKQLKQFKILYQWLQIARQPEQTLSDDIKMMMDLIKIPVSSQEVKFLTSVIDPQKRKQKLGEQDFIHCFMTSEDKKKQKQKEVVGAFKFVADGQEHAEFNSLKLCLMEQGLDEQFAQLVLKQMGDWETDQGLFDYKKFAASSADR